ncbi:MAG: MBOAT family protein [Bacteroidales bacterium]|nr:MBOAT family protein [Bacteroidales bacterium]
MSFNSLIFSAFLPIVFCLYWFVFGKNLKWQNAFVVAASYVFYGWWSWKFLILIAITSFCSWWSGLLIYRLRDNRGKARLVSAVNIILNLGILGLFKYYDFFAQSFADLFLGGKADGILLHLILPVGISFYTFQALSYSIDVYRGKIEPTRDIVQFFAFVSFFPQLVAGPIERATNLLPQFGRQREFEYSSAVDGMRQILWGYFKKIVIADWCGVYVDEVFKDIPGHSGVQLVCAAVLFAFQIYGDFSGYSDIAIGTAKLFGIKLRRNFSTPYFSRDVAEFWRRWHISLTTWFRDYVYIPLGGSRGSKAMIIRNTFVIFLVSGLWHGANWTFLAWGAFHALLFLPLILSGNNRKYKEIVAPDRALPSIREFGQMLLTFVLVTIGWVIFRADDLPQAWAYLSGMISNWGSFREMVFLAQPVFLTRVLWIVIMLVVEWLDRKEEHGLSMVGIRRRVVRYAIYFAILLVTILYFDDGSPKFIYFQF